MLFVVFFSLVVKITLGLHLCESVEVERAILPDETESTTQADGLNFTEGTYWQEDGKTYGCPGKEHPCLKICSVDGKKIKIPSRNVIFYFAFIFIY